MKTPVHMLSPGDVLKGSGETVVNISAGIKTPKGRIEVVLSKNNNKRLAVWGKYTIVVIEAKSVNQAI